MAAIVNSSPRQTKGIKTMFKTYQFNTNDCSKECRYFLGIHGTKANNTEKLKVAVTFHRLRVNEPVSMMYIGGIIIKPGMPHWFDFNVMLERCIARNEAEKSLDDDCLVAISQLGAKS